MEHYSFFASDSDQGWTGLVDLPGSPHKMVQQRWILPGPTFYKVKQSTSSKSKMPGEPRHGLWPYRDQGVIPMVFAGAVQPWFSSRAKYMCLYICTQGPIIHVVLVRLVWLLNDLRDKQPTTTGKMRRSTQHVWLIDRQTMKHLPAFAW